MLRARFARKLPPTPPMKSPITSLRRLSRAGEAQGTRNARPQEAYRGVACTERFDARTRLTRVRITPHGVKRQTS